MGRGPETRPCASAIADCPFDADAARARPRASVAAARIDDATAIDLGRAGIVTSTGTRAAAPRATDTDSAVVGCLLA